ncbi:hypothetical protein L1049_001511 [Liquidambar formosana]|uniref:Uncharacterized protein n=1 Tax=Liquidambar formosana TaxID=63359 RepID=A0AAP0NB75_LIQFO
MVGYKEWKTHIPGVDEEDDVQWIWGPSQHVGTKQQDNEYFSKLNSNKWKKIIGRHHKCTCQDHMWVGRFGDFLLGGGDQVDVVVTPEVGVKVKKCGVHLYDHEESSTQSDGGELIMYDSAWNENAIIVGDDDDNDDRTDRDALKFANACGGLILTERSAPVPALPSREALELDLLTRDQSRTSYGNWNLYWI